MPNNYTPRRAAPDREPERRRSSSPAPRETRYSQERRAPRETGYTSQTRQSRSSSEGYTRTPGYTAEDLTPRPPRNTTPRTSRETRPMRETRRETSTYVHRSVPSRRRRKKQPPILPILLLLVIVVLAVVIFFVVRGCSSQPTQGGGTPNSSQSSAVSGETSGAASGTPESNASGAAATPTPAPSEEPTPAPQEDPDAAPETVGGLLIVGDTAYEYYNFKEEYANQYITAVADAGEKLNGIATVYDMVIPTSIDIDLPESYIDRNQLNTSDQRQAIEDYIYPSINAMNSSVKTVSVFDALKSHANEYLYFRTDHHWTQLGAYYAYVEFCKVRGFEPVALDQFDKQEYTGYLGSFYTDTQSGALAANPDTVEAYFPQADTTLNATQDDGTVLENWPLIADGDTYGETMKYLIFAAGDQPYEEITNNDMAEGPSCIVVKESFGNCFIPFLVNHYKNVYVVDYRHYEAGTVTQLAQEKGVDDVLLLSNISMTRNEGLVSQFSNIF